MTLNHDELLSNFTCFGFNCNLRPCTKAGEKFAFDSYRRFLDMYGDVVMGIEHSLFEAEMSALKREVRALHCVE